MEMKEQTPHQGNLLRQVVQASSEGHPVTKTVLASDLVFSEFPSLQSLGSFKISQMEILSKQLDKPLNPVVSFFATVAQVEKTHQFLLFRSNAFLLTVDYYEKNRLVVRIGDGQFVLGAGRQDSKRREATVLEETNGLMWRVPLDNDEFLVGKLLQMLLAAKLPDHSRLAYSGHHFSRQIFNRIQADYLKK